ncbi:MAG: ATP-binding cassette domain-containing protein [Betaproteobacteria bacterium]
MTAAMLKVEQLRKVYTRGVIKRETTFTLEADFSVDGPGIIGVMGPNGSGKTTLFELITGSNQPTAGRVLCAGQDIHQVRYGERGRLAMHYHQSYQVRSFKRRKPEFMLARASSPKTAIHLFDEPQFNTQDGYIGFMLDFFRQLKDEGCLVFVCLHPNEPYHVELLHEICDRFLFVNKGKLSEGASLTALTEQAAFRDYLGRLVEYVPPS